MAANPNSELVFDFPDPTPRFDFDQSSSTGAGASSPKKRTSIRRGKRFGRFSKAKSAALSTVKAGSSSPGKSVDTSLDTDTTAEESWVDSLTSEEGSRNNGSGNGHAFRSSSPAGSKGSASGAPQRAWLSSKIRGASPNSLDLSKHSGTSGGSVGNGNAAERLNLPSPRAGRRHRRTASGGSKTAASGYISETTADMSEFSFDRVTVTTNETSIHTGMSSSINWGFISDGALDQMGLSTKDYTPYVGRAGGQPQPPSQTCPHPYQDANVSSPNAARKTSDAVSLSSCGSENDIPMSGIVSGDAQSLISEISEEINQIERGRDFHEESDAVRRLLAGEDGGGAAMSTSTGAKVTVWSGNTDAVERESTIGSCDDRTKLVPDFPDIMSIASTTADHANGLLDKLSSSYGRFRISRPGDATKKSVLAGIAENFQACGVWLCGNDTTLAEGRNDAAEGRCTDGKDRLLGMVIGCNPTSCFDRPTDEEVTREDRILV